jgi:hypothetical protein
VGGPEYAQRTTGESITRGNSGNGALHIPEKEQGREQKQSGKGPGPSKSVTVWSYERALRHQTLELNPNLVIAH